MQSTTIHGISTAAFVAMIFGNDEMKPFEVKLVRTRVEGTEDKWAWSVMLPMENKIVQRYFERKIMDSILVTNDELPATLVIAARKTNVGYETRFEHTNCTFRKGGMRRLRKLFTDAVRRWSVAREIVGWAWDMGSLKDQMDAKVIDYCEKDSEGVHNLRVMVSKMPVIRGAISYLMEMDEKNTVVLVDPNGRLIYSGFSVGVQRALEEKLRELAKLAMTECMNMIQAELVGTAPTFLLAALKTFVDQRDRVEMMGIPVKIDANVSELMAHLEEYLLYKAESEKPGREFRFKIYKAGELVREVRLGDKVLKIGRRDDLNHIKLDDESVPLIHSVIEQTGAEGVWLIELGTEMPTMLNGVQIEGKRALQNGDKIGVGMNFSITVEFLPVTESKEQVGAAAPVEGPAVEAAKPETQQSQSNALKVNIVDSDGQRELVFQMAGREKSISLGCDKRSDIKLNGHGVARMHAVIEQDVGKGTIVLLDLGAQNPVTVNSKPVGKATLNSGDVIGVGNCTITVTFESAVKSASTGVSGKMPSPADGASQTAVY